MIYFDTSALAKKYVKESGSDLIKKIIKERVLATSKITYPEMLSALVRRVNTGDISKNRLVELINEFETDLTCFIIIDFQDELFTIIKEVIIRHFLKAADSVHLSSALWLRQTVNKDITFVASDTNLLKAAQFEGLQVINPQEI